MSLGSSVASPEKRSFALVARIQDYALIGDCETAALVSRAGSIDWLCLPRFDSDACFAAILGSSRNGRWRISCADPKAKRSRRYWDGALILETRIETAGGVARVIDFMPPRDGRADVVRIVIGDSGEVAFRTEIVVRFDYGLTVPWVNRMEDGTIQAIAGPHRVTLQSDVPLHGEDMRTVGDFAVKEGETVSFVLTQQASTATPLKPLDPQAALKRTEAFWRSFSKRAPEVGRWTEPVRRSLIVLKALTYEPTGGIVAAPTTSLPEKIGGVRNWDYRYCWVRDACFTLQAFMDAGYYDEASAWRDWLMRSIAGSPAQMQIMYGIAGERRLPEWEASWLPGHRGSAPVRIGNAAVDQRQLDVFGELADALSVAQKGGLPPHPRAMELRPVIMKFLETAWREPDEGIWEVRGGRRHFTHSKVMAWVAFDRAASSAERNGEKQLAKKWRAIADEIHTEVCAKAFDEELNAFVQSYGSKALDASVLLIPHVGFLPPDDPRVVGTVAAIERKLMRGGLVMRYDLDATTDGLPSDEGAFLACSFWLADCLLMQGRRADAEELFERLVGLCNDVGLLAEEYDVDAGEMVGNFPQAFSHVGLINTALNLSRTKGPAMERAADGHGVGSAPPRKI
ncbi:glucoamylase [Alsobacter metallidurans]|uniref:Trehalase n=1 Tax=Alsobacter metallidurans TaxID=340221 RepID=A0A917I6Q0_9HYPH|nr:glucoamylase [Alsobacter metallidurans]